MYKIIFLVIIISIFSHSFSKQDYEKKEKIKKILEKFHINKKNFQGIKLNPNLIETFKKIDFKKNLYTSKAFNFLKKLKDYYSENVGKCRLKQRRPNTKKQVIYEAISAMLSLFYVYNHDISDKFDIKTSGK
jgi:hypothetical protein